MAYTTVHAPRGMPEDLGRMSNTKKRLVDLMEEFRKEGDRVNPTEEQVSLAEQLAKEGDATRYTKIQFDSIVQNNMHKDGYKEMMVTAFDVLFRYTVNMLKLKRPRNWYTIKFSNAQFKARADCMAGTRDILQVMGYTKPSYGEDGVTQTGLAYPDPSQINYGVIKLIGAELLTAKTEVKMAYEGRGGVMLTEGWYGSNVHPPHPSTVSPQMRPSYTEQHAFQDPSDYGRRPPQQSDIHSGYPPNQNNQSPQFSRHPVHQNEPQQDGWASQRSVDMYGSSNRSDIPLSDRSDIPLTSSPNSQHHDYQASMQTTQSEDSSRSFSSQVSSPPDLNTSGSSSRLEALKLRKANAIKVFKESSGNGANTIPPSSHSAVPSTAPIAVLREAPPQPKPRRNHPVPPNKPSANPPSTNPPSDVIPPSGLPEAAPPTDVPMQKPHVQRPAVRIMFECNMCDYPNHEKSQICMDCGAPKNEQWSRIEVPVKARNVPNNESTQPPPPPWPAPNDEFSQSPPRQSSLNTKPSPHGATGGGDADSLTSTPLTNFLPPPKQYTKEEKKQKEQEALMARQEIDKRKQLQQQQGQQQKQNGMDGSRDVPLVDYMTHNNNYSQGESLLVGNVLDFKHTNDGQDTDFYKGLSSKGELLVQDIKVGLREGYRMEELQLATELYNKYNRRTPFDFLLYDWRNLVDHAWFRASEIDKSEHQKRKMVGGIGNPSKQEVRKLLIEERGDCESAAKKCCETRMKKIQQLMEEVSLPQSAAILALEDNGLDVNKAIQAVYREKLTNASLYEHMWKEELEGGGILQKHREKVENMIKEKQHRDEYLCRLLMAEYKMPGYQNCQVVFQLVRDDSQTLAACIDVAKSPGVNIASARELLNQECTVCFDTCKRDDMVNMIQCDHAVCKNCFVEHFNLVIAEKSIKHFNCVMCKEPDMSSDAVNLDLYLQMFSGLVQNYMDKSSYDMCMKKLNDHTMQKEPNFCWCAHCSTGFINENAGRQKVTCVDCKEDMCFQCKKQWKPQHDDLSCEKFAEWERLNDPEQQKQGLAAHLNKEGIECPVCHFPYELAKGGCMHFTCSRCPTEFCSGCNGIFKRDCTKYESCRKKGFHAHHPRDCLFYLRDEKYTIEGLQQLLRQNNVEYDTQPPEGQLQAAAAADDVQPPEDGELVAEPISVVLKCHVMLQKEDGENGKFDEECSKPVDEGHAGLCETHYKEYLVFLINQHFIDPLPLYELGPMKGLLSREDMNVLEQNQDETEDVYRQRLMAHIQKELPLQKIKEKKK